MKVLEESAVVDYLKQRKLEKAYLKAKKYLELGYFQLVDLRKRNPKNLGIFYFKITQKYRAIGYIQNEVLVVTEISDHQ